MTQAIGWNVHLRYLGNPGKWIDRVRQFNPSTLVVMVDDPKRPEQEDQTKYIVEVAQELPETLIVARVKHDHDGGFHSKPQGHPAHYIASPDDFLNKWGHLGRGNMTLYALNEPNDGIDDNGLIDLEAVDRLNTWYVEVLDKAAERAVSVTGPNFGKGIPFTKNGEWHPAFDPILYSLSKHRGLHLAGLHEYGPEDEPFHLGRYKAMLRRCKTLKIPAPRIIFTEWGVDKADTGDQTINGYKSRKWSGTYYVNWLTEKQGRIYKADIEAGIIVGFDVFSMGASSPDWGPFNVEEDEGFWGELKIIRDRGELMTTKPIRQFVPKPDNASRPMMIRLKKARSLWSGPGTDFQNDGELPAGTVLTLYDAPTMADKDKRPCKWAEIDATRGGWLGLDGLAFEKVDVPPFEPPVVEPPLPPVPPPAAEVPSKPERREREFKIVITATDEEAAEIAVRLVNLANAFAGFCDLWKTAKPRIVIQDLSNEGVSV